ncbi:hypothetical protein QBE52_00575 [Clostridiaceae bacterium 35-E11]
MSILCYGLLPQETLSDRVKIGVGDDMSGFVLDYMLRDESLKLSDHLEAYFIKDC